MNIPALPAPRAPAGAVAFVASNAMGDTLISMVIVRNLIDHGFDVTVYGTPAYALRECNGTSRCMILSICIQTYPLCTTSSSAIGRAAWRSVSPISAAMIWH
jgi:hypothetical protein